MYLKHVTIFELWLYFTQTEWIKCNIFPQDPNWVKEKDFLFLWIKHCAIFQSIVSASIIIWCSVSRPWSKEVPRTTNLLMDFDRKHINWYLYGKNCLQYEELNPTIVNNQYSCPFFLLNMNKLFYDHMFWNLKLRSLMGCNNPDSTFVCLKILI